MIRHRPYHWLLVLAVLALAIFAWREVHGQTTSAQANFNGRPAMAGAQAGLGAQAGPPQGGIGLQGSEGLGLNLRRPQNVSQAADMPQGRPLDEAERRGHENTATSHSERQALARGERELPAPRTQR